MKKLTEIPLMFFLLSFAILISLSCVSAASTVYVNATGSDSNLGTIDSPFQTINKGMSSVDDNGTVKIANGNYTGVGNVNLTISKNMTIVGQSQKGTVINGTGTNWVFNISSGFNVTIQNLTITNATATNGGAIWNEGTLNVKGCTFTNNTATRNNNDNDGGGAIYNTGTITNMSGCTFTGNNASRLGGALVNYRGTINNISGCTFTSNKAIAAGAIYNYGGTITTINNCTFTGNTAVNIGGAISIYQSGIISNVIGCIFANNTAETMDGGAIIVWNGGNLNTVHYSSFVNNTANNDSRDICCYDGYGSPVDAKYNWWGSNSIPAFRIFGNIDISHWLLLSINANPTEILNTKNSKVTVDLYKDSDNGDHSSEAAKYPSEIPLKFTTTWGSITQIALTHGTGTAIFTANGGQVPQQNPITVSVADALNPEAVESTNITIKPTSDLYINTKSTNQNPKTGDTFTLTYKLGNKGPDEAKNVTITFQIPEGLEFVNISVDNGKYSYDKATRTVTWTLDSVPLGDPYLYLTVLAAGNGTYKITPSITSETYNLNSGDFGIITFNVQPNSNSNENNNNNNSNNNENTVNAASKTTKTIGLQETGLPLNYLILAVLMVLSGLVPKRK